ncbi:hypothetical protein GGQ59_002916 [Parvularcula dongshanensis]|uniref:Uncharacterized protein n=1 Tax=Parvularcula dongshanensis TaxID=1173995 RepID=A0A840I881_9PROT|nr:hypothetical protein [Parvularcula dongshanensis]
MTAPEQLVPIYAGVDLAGQWATRIIQKAATPAYRHPT